MIALVGIAHGVSHFYHLILAALFPWLKPAFDLSYAELGLLMTAFFVVSGLGQALAGFVVDRIGALRVLLFGMTMLGLSGLLLAAADSYAALLAGALLAGVGNSVFHPADYTLLNECVSDKRLAAGFSVHGIGGTIGWAVSPLFMGGVAALLGWRLALACAALLPFAMAIVLLLNRTPLRAGLPAQARGAQSPQDKSLAFLRLPALWMGFAFFLLTSVALGGIQSFASLGLEQLYGIAHAQAARAYMGFMLASACGTVAGGFGGIAARHYGRTIAVSFALAAALALLLGSAVAPAWASLPLMALIGFLSGVSGPARDLMVRQVAPQGAVGRVYGLVYSGLDIGLSLGPLLFGVLMDARHPGWMFAATALLQVLAIGTTLDIKRTRHSPPAITLTTP